MFDYFTQNSKKALNMARQEAQRFNHESLGPEHLLLGLLSVGRCVAVRMLERLGTNPAQVRAQVEKVVMRSPNPVSMGQLPFTPRAKKVLELSMEEAGHRGDNHIGTEHLLLGITKEKESVGAQALAILGVTIESAREKLLELSSESSEDGWPPRRKRTSANLEDVVERLRAVSSLLRMKHQSGAADKIEGIIRDLQS